MKLRLNDMINIMRDRVYKLGDYERVPNSELRYRAEFTSLIRDIDDLLKEVMEFFNITEEDLRKEMDGRTD